MDKELLSLKLCDMHIHIDDYPIVNSKIAESRGLKKGDLYRVYNLEKLAHHLTRDEMKVEEAYMIFTEPDSLEKIAEKVPETKIYGWYWLRFKEGKIQKREIKELENVVETPRIQGIKIHPVLDNFELRQKNIQPVLDIAREYDLAILSHYDDRRNSDYLTHPRLYEPIIANNPDINFVIGHGGAFTAHRIGNGDKAVKKFIEKKPVWYKGMDDPSRNFAYWNRVIPLINEAMRISTEYENAYYETSYCNKGKAAMIKWWLESYPEFAEKILIGTDFPLSVGYRVQSQIENLYKTGVKIQDLKTIARNRLPKKD